eukprot:850044-Pelagomonas_calceolata.AAC.1
MEWQTEKPENLDESYDGHQRECLGGQCSSSAGIVGCDPEGRLFFLELLGPNAGGQHGCGLAGPHSLARKEPLQLRCKASRSRWYGLMQAHKLGPIESLVKDLESARV